MRTTTITKNDKTTKDYSGMTDSEYARCVKANPPIADERLWRGSVPDRHGPDSP